MRVILWDIDGTLLDTEGAGRRALAEAVKHLPGAADLLGRMPLGGLTDRKIARSLAAAERHRIEGTRTLDEHEAEVLAHDIDALLARYLAALGDFVAATERYRVLPGVEAALDGLLGRAIHALGTGNLEDGARIKLARVGLWERFAFGGYGSDAEHRADVIRAGWEKAKRHFGRDLPAHELVVVGDTPRDVLAAHDNGIACVAVATGGYKRDALVAAGADAVLDSLEDSRAIEIILESEYRR